MMFYAKRDLNRRDDGHIYPPDCIGPYGRRALDWLSANAKTEGMFNIFTWTGGPGEICPRWDVDRIIWEEFTPVTGGRQWIALHLIQAT